MGGDSIQGRDDAPRLLNGEAKGPEGWREGSAPGSGGQPGNQNARKHGFYGKAAVAERRRLRALIRALEAGLMGVG